MWMQAVRNMHIRFIILDPLSVVDEYKPDIPESLLRSLAQVNRDAQAFCDCGCRRILRYNVLKVPLLLILKIIPWLGRFGSQNISPPLCLQKKQVAI